MPETEIETPEVELTLAEELSKAFDEVEARENPPEEKPAAPEEKPAEEAKEEADAPTVEEKPAVTPPPLSWSSAVKEKWATLPPEVQAEISKREKEVERGFTKNDEERNLGKNMKEVITPYMPMIQAEGGTPVAAVRDLLNTAYVLRTGNPQQKAQLLHQVARQYGVDLGQVSPAQTNVDPQYAALQQQVQTLTMTVEQERALKQQQEQSSLTSQIEAFASDPSNAHFETVKAHMASLLQSGLAKDLKDAYDQAVYANPQTRSTLLEAQKAEYEAKRLAEQKAKADKARRASSSVKGGVGSSSPSAGKEMTLREEIAAQFENAGIF